MSEATDFFDWEHASAFIRKLDVDWMVEIEATKARRKIRYHDVDEIKLKERLQPHESYIPRRVADTNIRREMPVWISYVTQSPRVGVFKCLSGKTVDTGPLEVEFSDFVKYEGWEIPFFKVIDGCMTHGTDFVETIFDKNKPGHFANIHVGHERVKYPTDTEDIQKAPAIVVDCVYGADEMRGYVDDPEIGWNAQHVEEVIKDQEGKEDTEGSFTIRKLLFKQDGVTYIGYWHDKSTGWLKAPDKLFLGKRNTDGTQVEETEYNIEPLPYTVSEDGLLMNVKGRVFLDMHDQQAVTQLVSHYMSGLSLSCRLQAAPKHPTDAADHKQTDATIENGKVWNNPTDFFHIPPPPAEVLGGADKLLAQNANEQSRVDYAATNRTDSRKTATEISSANQQASQLSSVQVTNLGLFMRNVLRRCYDILKSQVEQGTIQTAHREKYAEKYVILPAGDTDVVRRQERQLKLRQDWPVFQTIPGLAEAALETIIRESYPDVADKWVLAMKQGDVKGQMLAAVPQMLKQLAASDPNVAAALAPHQQQLAQVEQQIQQALNPEAQQGQPQQQPAAPEGGGY